MLLVDQSEVDQKRFWSRLLSYNFPTSQEVILDTEPKATLLLRQKGKISGKLPADQQIFKNLYILFQRQVYCQHSFFSTDVNVLLSTYTFKSDKYNFRKQQHFILSIFTGISMLCITFPLLDLLISFKTSSTLTVEKPKSYGLNKFLIANTL